MEYGSSLGLINWFIGASAVDAQNIEELNTLVHTISHRVAGLLERRGLLERDSENRYLALELDDDDVISSCRAIQSLTALLWFCSSAGKSFLYKHCGDT